MFSCFRCFVVCSSVLAGSPDGLLAAERGRRRCKAYRAPFSQHSPVESFVWQQHQTGARHSPVDVDFYIQDRVWGFQWLLAFFITALSTLLRPSFGNKKQRPVITDWPIGGVLYTMYSVGGFSLLKALFITPYQRCQARGWDGTRWQHGWRDEP